MATTTIEQLVQGGKATAAPPLGPALGPLGVNIGQVISEINKKTADFKGMQVPVKISVDTSTKEFTISVGTPPTSALIKSEAKIEKGSGNPAVDKVSNLKIEQVIKIAKMKDDSLLGRTPFAKIREVLGSCHSIGVLVEDKDAREMMTLIEQAPFKDKILKGKTELSAEEIKALEAETKKLQQEAEQRKTQYMEIGKQILESLAGKPRSAIKAKMLEAKIPAKIIEELLPAATTAEGAPGAAGAKPAAAPAKK